MKRKQGFKTQFTLHQLQFQLFRFHHHWQITYAPEIAVDLSYSGPNPDLAYLVADNPVPYLVAWYSLKADRVAQDDELNLVYPYQRRLIAQTRVANPLIYSIATRPKARTEGTCCTLPTIGWNGLFNRINKINRHRI